MTNTFDAQWQTDIEDMLSTDADMERRQNTENGLDKTDDSWLPDWVLKHPTALDAQAATAKEQYERRMREVQRIREYLRETYGERLRAEVQRQLDAQDGQKKSVDYAMGRAGFRRIPERTRIEVDQDEALADVMDRCPEAVQYSIRKSALQPLLDQGETIPGVSVEVTPAHERFYIGSESIDEPQSEHTPTVD